MDQLSAPARLTRHPGRGFKLAAMPKPDRPPATRRAVVAAGDLLQRLDAVEWRSMVGSGFAAPVAMSTAATPFATDTPLACWAESAP